ncbi:hypothetical protein GCM10023184_29770 [Flaviaesturariibacter amylovorans]|uniref:Uncharacterized protein n=1 Tax=Flaviaesturariibacter amylovorans TaxID=1084520 RepID=A0ABP8H6T3_9BACT
MAAAAFVYGRTGTIRAKEVIACTKATGIKPLPAMEVNEYGDPEAMKELLSPN